VPQEDVLLFQQDVTIHPAESDYQYETVQATLKPGAEYRLSMAEITVDAGITDTVTASLYDTTTKTRLANHHFALQNGTAYAWDFTVPEDASDGVRVLLYAGKLGATNNIGITCTNVVLERTDLLPEEEKPQAAAPVYTSLEARDVTIAPTEDSYTYGSFHLSLEPGATYSLSMQGITLDAGQASAIDLSLYHPVTKTHLLLTSLPIAQGESVWRFQAPAGSDACQLLLYAGPRGETAGVGITLQGLSLTKEKDAPLGDIVLQQSVSLEPANEDYHYTALNANLDSDTPYRITVEGVEFTAGQAEKLSLSLYDPVTREQLVRGTIDLTADAPYAWEFYTTMEDLSLWQVLVYAGERGKTANVGLTIEKLTISEVE